MHSQMILAKYLRISLEDDQAGESNSISNQRHLIDNYILKQDDLADYENIEYVDDGYSGTSFNRPAVKDLLEALRKGKVHCIIVKDFSRFSRDYIELGNYLEQVFPFLEVRFISINDNYDSKITDAVQSGLDVPFKGILYDLYSKDISNKVKASKRQLIKQGKLCSGSHPYGYVKSTREGQTYEIDPEAANVVKMIFELALEGKSNIEIARTLNEKQIVTPGMYKRENGYHGYGLKEGAISKWDSTRVHTILRDERYTGALILGKYQSAGLGTGRCIHMPREQWYTKEGNHPEIVTKREFDLVQQGKKPYLKKGKRKGNHILFRKVKCAHCGRFMYHKPSEHGNEYNSFFCKQPHLLENSTCYRGYIKENLILEALLHTINVHASIAVQTIKNQRNQRENSEKKKENLANQEKRVQKIIERLLEQKGELYKKYKVGELSKEQFLESKEKISEEIKRLEEEQEVNTNKEAEDDFMNTMKEFHGIKELTREVIEKTIDSIEVYDGERIKINLLYRD